MSALSNCGAVSVDSARGAVELLTSELSRGERKIAEAGLVAGLVAAFKRDGSPVPEWLRELMGEGRTVPLHAVLADLRQAAEDSSWRQLGREINLNPRTLQMIAEHGAVPRRTTETKLRRWISARRG